MNDDRSYDREKQLSVARALLAMLIAADKADVPPVRWTVNVSGWSLYGEIGLEEPRGIPDLGNGRVLSAVTYLRNLPRGR
jgi:hypothetical protein